MCETYGSSYGVFDCINCAHSDTGYANALKDSAIARSSGYGETLSYNAGRLDASGLNVTRNNCDLLSSGIYCYSDIDASLSFSAFTNNTCDYMCICFNNNQAYNEMHACYVIDNKQSLYSTYGTIYCRYYLTITDSYINNNVASRDFWCDSGTITVKNCVVNMSKATAGTVEFDDSCKESAEIIDIDFRDDCYVWMLYNMYRVEKRCTCMRLQRQCTGRKNVLLAFLYV